MPLKDPNTAYALVRGLVDAIQHPAFVISKSVGLVACNKSAKSIKGKDLSSLQMSDGQIVDIGDKQYRVISKKLNHKTDCVLFELHDVTDPAVRLKSAGALLDKALSGAF